MKSNADEIYQALSRPWPPGQVKERKGPGSKMLSYVDARQVQNRLDEVVGSGNWQTHFTEVCGNYCCTLAIKIDGEWVAKSDGAGGTSIEGDKGGFSDAFKRAAVSFGVARYLYTDSQLTPEQFDARTAKTPTTDPDDVLTAKDLIRAIQKNDKAKANLIWESVSTSKESSRSIWRILNETERDYIKLLREKEE